MDFLIDNYLLDLENEEREAAEAATAPATNEEQPEF